ncbi:hypothetical protein F5X68DRAFT_22816 [Plectosphaerella plurivora]|uniref:AA1-like domain-containing protein n=1 Tax=Plectosphaerella plurivora TaxID=936078 RepID=A0A9P9A8I7_9PEZI|nr:hypothetical protein F5X68DRAFT_22816 [Plectosphaerella plurivora]
MRSILFLLLAPLALASPVILEARNTTKSCMARSPGMTEWELEDFDFHASYIFSTPSHQNSWGNVTFTAFNSVHNTRTRCSAKSNRLNDFFYGEVEYACDTNGDANLGAAKFTFNRPSGEVTMEQTWYCHDNPNFPPARFTAKGDVVTQLKCEETTFENGNWTMGSSFSQRDITCELVDVVVPVKELTGIAR